MRAGTLDMYPELNDSEARAQLRREAKVEKGISSRRLERSLRDPLAGPTAGPGPGVRGGLHLREPPGYHPRRGGPGRTARAQGWASAPAWERRAGLARQTLALHPVLDDVEPSRTKPAAFVPILASPVGVATSASRKTGSSASPTVISPDIRSSSRRSCRARCDVRHRHRSGMLQRTSGLCESGLLAQPGFNLDHVPGW